MAFAIRNDLKNTNMRHLPKLLFSSILFCLINTFPTWGIVNHEMGPLAYVNSYLDEGALCPISVNAIGPISVDFRIIDSR